MTVGPLLGRADVLALLNAHLRGVGQHGGTPVLRGAVGIGKTALLEVARSEARSRGTRSS